MAATPLNTTERYSALDGFEVVFVPTIAAHTDIPTRTEINAGTDLTSELDGVGDGWNVETDSIKMPGLIRFEPSLVGKKTIGTPKLRVYADRGGDDIADVLPEGTVGYILRFPTGDRTGGLMSIWPIRVGSLVDVDSTDAASMHEVTFAVLRPPTERVSVPA